MQAVSFLILQRSSGPFPTTTTSDSKESVFSVVGLLGGLSSRSLNSLEHRSCLGYSPVASSDLRLARYQPDVGFGLQCRRKRQEELGGLPFQAELIDSELGNKTRRSTTRLPSRLKESFLGESVRLLIC